MEGKEGVEALFQFATEGILLVDEKGKIMRANPSSEKLFGYEKDELFGQKIEILVPKSHAHKHEHHRTNFHNKPQARSMGNQKELFGLRKDGSEFPVEISLSPYESSHGKFVIAFIIDVTIKNQEKEKLRNYSVELEKQVQNRTSVLLEAIVELEKTKKELQKVIENEKELNELKSRFVSMASHEFRTPLTTMMSSLSLVTQYSEQNDSINQKKHVAKIKKSIHHLTDILNDFLSVGKLEEGKIEYLPKEINLKNLLNDVLSEMKSMAQAKQNLVLIYNGKEDVFLDPRLLKNVLFNLISNAIKFSDEGKTIEINIQVQNSTLKISIKDEGIGISKKDQKHLFERFFRGHNAIHIQGTGLGLNIVANYIELMNGSINYESEENKGSTFNIIIPQ